MKNRWTNRKGIQYSLLITLAFSVVTSVVQAQPSWSRGEQSFQISFQEAMSRAENALRTEGYVNLNTQANMVYGYKGENSAVITCNEGTNGRYWINIFVASLTNNSGVPGNERVKLQQRMNQPGTTTIGSKGCGLGRTWNIVESGITMIWTRRGSSNIFDVTGTVGGAPFTAEQTIEISGNKVFANRYKAGDGNTCTFTGTIASDGITVTGNYDCTKYKPSSGWQAKINCN